MKRTGIGRGVTGRLSGGHLLMLAVGALGAVSTYAAIASRGDVVSVVVAKAELHAGDQIGANDLALAEVSADDPLLSHFLKSEGQEELVGMIVASPISHGDPILAEDLIDPATGDAQRTMSFAVSSDRAVGGSVALGDRIDVIAVSDSGKAGYALVDALVIDSGGGGSGSPMGGAASDDVVITVALDADDALRLAGAIENAEVRIARATGAEPIDELTWYELGEDSHTIEAIDA